MILPLHLSEDHALAYNTDNVLVCICSEGQLKSEKVNTFFKSTIIMQVLTLKGTLQEICNLAKTNSKIY